MRREKKKKLIIDAALRLFSKYGFHGTAMTDITKSMGMSAGNIYIYFPSKKSLAKSAMLYVSNQLTTILHDINNLSLTSQQKVTLFVEEYVDFLQESPEYVNYFMKMYLINREIFCDEEACRSSLAKTFVQEIKILVEKGVLSGEFREGDFCIALTIIIGLLGGIAFLASEGSFTSSLATYSSELSLSINKALSV